MLAPIIVTSRTDLAALLRGDREAQGFSGEELDAEIGFSDRYSGKAENPKKTWGRRLLHLTAMGDLWLSGLNRCLVLMDRAQAEQLIAEHAANPPTDDNRRIHMKRVRGMRIVTW